MRVKSAFSQTHDSQQTAIAVEGSRVAMHRSHAMIEANKQVLAQYMPLRKSYGAIAASRDTLSQQTSRHTFSKRRGF
jgi:hypothetical protein